MSEKYTIGEIQPTKINQFEVIIVGDMNDGDYVTTREFFSEDEFNSNVIDELIELLSNYSDDYKLRSFTAEYIRIPFDGQEHCHSLESVEVNYYDNNGSVRPVKINSGFYTVCQKCDWDLEECQCKGEDNE